jgi:hypothetical protein
MRCHTTRAIFAQCRALSSNGHGASRNRARHCSPRLHIACDFIQGGRTGHARTVSRRGCAPELCMDHPHGRQRAQGRLGAGRTHGPPATKKAGGSHHRFGRTFDLPCAMVLTVSFALSLGTGLSCPIAARIVSAQLGISVGMPGPHDFAIRDCLIRPRNNCALTPSRPSHPAPNVRDDREAPLMRARDGRSKT